MRPVTIMEKPTFHPYVCISCGLGGPPREWFVDIGIDLDAYFNPVLNGTVYFCNECWNSVHVNVSRQMQQWQKEHEAWSGIDSVEPTYRWENSGSRGTSDSGEPLDGNDQGAEPDDTESEYPDTSDADSTDDTSSDESTKRAFSALLGDG